MYNPDDEHTVFTSQTNKHTAYIHTYIHIWARSNIRRTVGVSLLLSLSRFLRGRPHVFRAHISRWHHLVVIPYPFRETCPYILGSMLVSP
jgi:hypothetical protein